MNDLIRRSELAQAMCIAICGEDRHLCTSLPKDCYQRYMKPLFSMPTVETAPVVHGRWVAKKVMIRTQSAKNYTCSECKMNYYWSNYCPNCGAKMDKEEA